MKALIIFFVSSCHFVIAGNLVQAENQTSACIVDLPVNSDSVKTEWKPDLYWGEHRSGRIANRNQISFFVKYATDVPLNELFTIQSLELSFNGRVAHISGNRLTDDIHSMIRELPSGATVYAYARYKDEKGVIRIIEGEWQLK